jgi:hypothetical protein
MTLPRVWDNGMVRVLSVGSVTDYEAVAGQDPGSVSGFSSRGPTGDDRWKPNVCAVGDTVDSCAAGTAAFFTESPSRRASSA